MKGSTSKDETIQLLKKLVTKPAIIGHEGWWTMTGFPILSWEVAIERLKVDKGNKRKAKFFIENYQRLVELGIVFVGKFLGYYPWKYCDPNTTIPTDLALRTLKAEFSTDVKKSEIRDMARCGFLGKYNEKSIPLFVKDRIIWIKECKSRFGYRDSQLKQLAEYEDKLMEHLCTLGISYKDYDHLNLTATKSKRLRSKNQEVRRDHHRGQAGKEKMLLQVVRKLIHQLKIDESLFPELSDVLDEVQKVRSKRDKKSRRYFTRLMQFVTRLAEILLFMHELIIRQLEVSYFREMVLGGCSPQISFVTPPEGPYGTLDIDKAPIDWRKSLINIENLELDFVRIPTFMIENYKGEINIRIKKPEAITSKEMDEVVQKVYKRIRDKVVTGKRPWGSVSGTKAYLAERDKKMKAYFREKIKPNAKSAEAAFKKLQELMEQEGYSPISSDRVKRIVYGKE